MVQWESSSFDLTIVLSPSQSTLRQIFVLIVIPLKRHLDFSSVAARQVKTPDAGFKVHAVPHILGAIIARLCGNKDLLTCQRSSKSMFELASKRLYRYCTLHVLLKHVDNGTLSYTSFWDCGSEGT